MKTLLLLLGLLIAGATSAQIVVTDFSGRQVSLPEAARRIVALSPHSVENAFSAGAGAALVGTINFSNYPEAARSIPRVGSHQAWSLESIIALQPDLILVWGAATGGESLSTLTRLGIPVYISEPRRLADIPRALRDIGQLAGTSKQAEAEAQYFEQELQRLRTTYGGRRNLSVFYEVWNQPLQTLNGEHFVSAVMELCGAHNVFADAPIIAPKINIESVLERNPDVILASGMDQARPEWLDDWRAYPTLRAVQQEALIFIHPDLLQRPTTRLLEGARQLCQQLDVLRQSGAGEAPVATSGE